MEKSIVIARDYEENRKEIIFSEIMEILQIGNNVRGKSVILKPNLCTERVEISHIANTSIVVIEQTIKYLKEFTNNIVIGESDGMRYSANAAFESNNIFDLAKKYDVKVVNFTEDEQVKVPMADFMGWGFSKIWIESDIFITLPKLKTHATTYFTGALKNQWGCVPRNDRILLHKDLNKMIGLVNKIKRPNYAIMDGIIAMEGRGPINGTPLKLDIILASNDPVAIDVFAMKLVSLIPENAIHVQYAAKNLRLGESNINEIEIDNTITRLLPKIKEVKTDWAIRVMNILSRSELMTKTFIMNDTIFYPLRKIVQNIRNIVN